MSDSLNDAGRERLHDVAGFLQRAGARVDIDARAANSIVVASRAFLE